VTSPSPFAEVHALLEHSRERRAFPGGVLAVGGRQIPLHVYPFGRLSYAAHSPNVEKDTLYDLASLTKVIVTTTLAMILVDEGRLALEAFVADILPGFRGARRDHVRVWHLLAHASGLPEWAPLHLEAQGSLAYLERIESMDLTFEPGTKSVYSDLGVILLGEVLERISGETLDVAARRRVLDPLEMRETLFQPSSDLRPRIAPTEEDPWRRRLIWGEVHDENAFAMGGVAPHAGLFGTALDLARFGQMLVSHGAGMPLSRETLERFTARVGIPGSSRALGWDTPSEGSSAGRLLSPRSFGHTGFTGTSLWVDPSRDMFVLLLTNRVHPTRENALIGEVRPAVADAVVRGLGAGPNDG
jgi:CubicO group peptidase (beta-lactamase class C family)